MFQTSVIFERNYNSIAEVIVNQGGTSSGKTYSILQVLCLKAIEQPDQVISVVGQDVPNLKSGALRDMQAIVASSTDIQS
jgi:phage terminase large subunit